MNRPNWTQRNYHAVLASAVLLVTALLTGGCPFGAPPANTNIITPAAGQSVASATPTPTPAPLAVVICLDSTISFTGSYQQGLARLTADISSLPEPGFPGAVLSAFLICEHTRQCRIGEFIISAVPEQPVEVTPQGTPTPEPLDNSVVFDKSVAVTATAEAHAASTIWNATATAEAGAHEQAIGEFEAALANARAEARDAADNIAGAPNVDAKSSDVFGCVSQAEYILRKAAGPRLLIMISDMEVWGYQDQPQALDLSGVKVRILLACENVSLCDQRETDWGATLDAAGASEVVFLEINEPGFLLEWR